MHCYRLLVCAVLSSKHSKVTKEVTKVTSEVTKELSEVTKIFHVLIKVWITQVEQLFNHAVKICAFKYT